MRTLTSHGTCPARACVALLAIALLGGCSGSSGGGGASSLTVVDFVGEGTDGFVFRDQPLVFRFSAPIDTESVSINALQVRKNGELVPGRIEIQGKEILWSPVVLPGDRNDYFPNNNPPINGLGFEGTTRYTVRMIANSPFAIHSRQGRPLSQPFQASFTTSNEFLPEEVPEPPVLDVATSPVFSPAPLVDGNPFSPNPADWPIVDPRRVSIRLDFSERVHPASLDPFTTITVVNISDVDVPGAGEPALVRLVQSPTADSVTAEALVSLGDDPDSSEPFEYEVRISGVADLALNPVEDDIVFHFHTADRPGEPNFGVVTETFANADMRDDANTSSGVQWGMGLLEGADVNARSIEFIPMLPRGPGVPPPNTFNLPHPLVEVGNPTTPNGSSFMMRFFATDLQMNDGESIVGLSWAPKSMFVFFSLYEDVTLMLGQKLKAAPLPGNELDFEYSRNYDQSLPNNPSVMFQGNYQTPAATDTRWFPWPEFQTDFEFSSQGNTHDLLFFWDMPEGGTTFQLFNNDSSRSFPKNRIFSNGGDSRARNGRENTQYEMRFEVVSKRSFATSLGYGHFATQGIPDYEAFLVLEDTARAGGTDVDVLWAPVTVEGGQAFLGDFSPNIDVADGNAAIAFRLAMTADPFTGIVPRIFSVSFAVADLDTGEG